MFISKKKKWRHYSLEDQLSTSVRLHRTLNLSKSTRNYNKLYATIFIHGFVLKFAC